MNVTWHENDLLVIFISDGLALPLSTPARGSRPTNVPDADYACRNQ
jgi:hypothetical protein